MLESTGARGVVVLALEGSDGWLAPASVGAADVEAEAHGAARDHVQAGCAHADTANCPEPGGAPAGNVLACGGAYAIIGARGACVVWVAGANCSGQLGTGDSAPRPAGELVAIPDGQELAGAACGSRHTILWMRSGVAYGFGSNFFSQLGCNYLDRKRASNVLSPCRLPWPSSHMVTKVAAGARHSVCLLEDGGVWACGDNSSGQLGIEDAPRADTLQRVDLPEAARDIACGQAHTVVLGQRDVFHWGNRLACCAGRADVYAPTPVRMALGDDQGRLVAAGANHSLLLTSNGAVWAWGSNSAAQLGHTVTGRPARVQGLPVATAVSGGDEFSAACGADGAIYMWGCNVGGLIAADMPHGWKQPQPTRLQCGSDAVAVCCGAWHLALVARTSGVHHQPATATATVAQVQQVENAALFPG